MIDKGEDVIYLGQHFMSEEIFIFDNTPYVKDDENYAQIGIGIENS